MFITARSLKPTAGKRAFQLTGLLTLRRMLSLRYRMRRVQQQLLLASVWLSVGFKKWITLWLIGTFFEEFRFGSPFLSWQRHATHEVTKSRICLNGNIWITFSTDCQLDQWVISGTLGKGLPTAPWYDFLDGSPGPRVRTLNNAGDLWRQSPIDLNDSERRKLWTRRIRITLMANLTGSFIDDGLGKLLFTFI